MKPSAILETCLYVDDLNAAQRFYGDVLGLECVSRQQGRHVFFRCGEGMLLVFDPSQSNAQQGEAPPHGSRGAGHVAFAVTAQDVDAWRRRLVDEGVEIEQVVAWPQGGRSLYFRDSAGNSVELATPRIWDIDEA